MYLTSFLTIHSKSDNSNKYSVIGSEKYYLDQWFGVSLTSLPNVRCPSPLSGKGHHPNQTISAKSTTCRTQDPNQNERQRATRTMKSSRVCLGCNLTTIAAFRRG